MTAARALVGTPDAARRLADLRSAALADEDGARLRAKLATVETELGKAYGGQGYLSRDTTYPLTPRPRPAG